MLTLKYPHSHFQHKDFTLPTSYDFPLTNYLTSFSGYNLFLPVHLARFILITIFGACGYKCFIQISHAWLDLLKYHGEPRKDSSVENLSNKASRVLQWLRSSERGS
jgi:hypothetical protein